MSFLYRYKKFISSVLVLAVLIIISVAVTWARINDNHEKYVFSDGWEWISGADDGSMPETLLSGEDFKPLDKETSQKLTGLCPDGTGYIWVRTSFTVPEGLKSASKAIFSKKILFAGEVYINGTPVGRMGRFPPSEFITGYKSGCFAIPDDAIDNDGTNILAIKIWVEGSGSIPQLIYLGDYDHVSREAEKASFFGSTINFAFFFALMIITIFYMFLYSLQKKKLFFYHAMLIAFSAIFLIPFFHDQFNFIPYLIPDHFLFIKCFAAIPAYIAAYFASSFIREFLQEKDSHTMYAIRLLILLIPILVTIFVPDLASLYTAQPVLILFVGFQIYFGVEAVCKALMVGKKEVYTLLAGFSPVLIAIPADVIVHLFPNNMNIPYITIYGWQGSILAFIFILCTRYDFFSRRTAYLAENMEQQIKDRTYRLSEINEKLEKDMEHIQSDMTFAIHVQEAFFKPPVIKSDCWDIAVSAKAAAGITGDMFEIYHVGNTVEGLSLFDVSGHGVASGLVTMFCKSIVERNFRNGLYAGETHENLGTIMENINREIITSKGDIENYLTGILMRVDNVPVGETCHAELSNAGSPSPLFFNAETGECREIKAGSKSSQYGMIGIRGLEVSFPPVSFSINSDDAVILFTDGVNEAVNKNNEQFGKERAAKAIETAGTTSAQGKLSALLNELNAFTDGVPIADDITVIVIQRKKETPVEFNF